MDSNFLTPKISEEIVRMRSSSKGAPNAGGIG